MHQYEKQPEKTTHWSGRSAALDTLGFDGHSMMVAVEKQLSF
jgi:hypothetical protein